MARRTQQPHFIPKFYLAGFTKDGQDDNDLHVFDLEKIRSWQSTPEKSARWRDFYRLGPGADPDAVEKALAKLEADWSRVIRQVSETRIAIIKYANPSALTAFSLRQEKHCT